MKKTKTIQVSEDTWKQLVVCKMDKRKASLDDVIKGLLKDGRP